MSDYQYGYSGPPLIVVCRHCGSKTEMTAASAIKFGGDEALWQVGCPSCRRPILETDRPTAEALAAEAEGAMDFEDPPPDYRGAALARAFGLLMMMDPYEISPTRLRTRGGQDGGGWAECDMGEVPVPMIVDGMFDADQLEAVAAWLRDPRGVASAAPPPGVFNGSTVDRVTMPDTGRVYQVLYDEAGEYAGIKRDGA